MTAKRKLDKAESRLKNFFIEFVEKTGTLPWQSSVIRTAFQDLSVGRNNKPYEGINALVTFMYRVLYKYDSNCFLTMNEINKRGGMVKKGEHACCVVYSVFIDYDEDGNKLTWKQAKEKRDNGEVVKSKFVGWKEWSVFNLAQTNLEYEHLPVIDTEKTVGDTSADKIVSGYRDCPKIVHDVLLRKGDGCYIPALDEVHLYPPQGYETLSNYYSTLFHELMHSTEHEKRLNIKNGTFGTKTYARCELRAEIGASMLMALTDLDDVLENNGAYVKSWLQKLKGTEDFGNAIANAFSSARHGVDYMLGKVNAEKKTA